MPFHTQIHFINRIARYFTCTSLHFQLFTTAASSCWTRVARPHNLGLSTATYMGLALKSSHVQTLAHPFTYPQYSTWSLTQRRRLWWGNVSAIETFGFCLWELPSRGVGSSAGWRQHLHSVHLTRLCTGRPSGSHWQGRHDTTADSSFRLPSHALSPLHLHNHLSRPVPSPSAHLHNILAGLGLWDVTDEPATSNPSQWAVTKQQRTLVTRRLMLGVCPIVSSCLLSVGVAQVTTGQLEALTPAMLLRTKVHATR